MINYHKYRLTNNWSRVLICLIVLAISISCTTGFAALTEIGFQLEISEKEMVLKDPDDMDMMKFEMWDTPFQRIQNRSLPWMKVTNLPGSTGNITEFSITIGDTDYNYTDETYGTFALLSDYTPVPITISSTNPTGDELLVTIGDGGVAPGDAVMFGVDLAPDPGTDGFPHPDFRLVLFDMNGDDSTDNAIATATFTDPNDTSMMASLSFQLEDYEVEGAPGDYFEHIIRPYSVMERIDVFGGGNSFVIPEPSTYAMISLALIGTGLWRRSRRRQERSVA